MKTSVDYNEWKSVAFKALYNKLKPGDLNWVKEFNLENTDEQFGLFTQDSNLLNLKNPSREYIHNLINHSKFKFLKDLIKTSLYFNNNLKFDLTYQALLKFIRNPDFVHNPMDETVFKLNQINKKVGRDIHKMRAFVRFNETTIEGKEFFVAFYQPDHHILKANAPFFIDRFSVMNWAIFTPYAVMAWNQEKLFYNEQKFEKPKTPTDPFVDLWKTYFSNIFNPSRLKVKAMKNEMPVRFWKNLPEADLIPDLIRGASAKVEEMRINHMKKVSENNLKLPVRSEEKSLASLRQKINTCENCSLSKTKRCSLQEISIYKNSRRKIMILNSSFKLKNTTLRDEFTSTLGESTLHKLLDENNLTPQDLYFSSAIKASLSQKDKTNTEQLMQCRKWLINEIDIIKPQLILSIGKKAAHSIMGYPIKITDLERKLKVSDFGSSKIMFIEELGPKIEFIDIFQTNLKLALKGTGISNSDLLY